LSIRGGERSKKKGKESKKEKTKNVKFILIQKNWSDKNAWKGGRKVQTCARKKKYRGGVRGGVLGKEF